MKTLFTILINICCLIVCQSIKAQYGIQLNTADALPKHVLVQSDGNYYLLDNCGEIVHQWQGLSYTLYHHAKLTKSGDLIFISSNAIHRVDWNSNETLVYENTDPDFIFDYEVIEMNNGNYLCVGRRSFTSTLKSTLAYDQRSSLYDVIVEVDPDQGVIVWEWKSIDHTIQDRDTSKENYGIIKDHPELLCFDRLSNYDWSSEAFMINGLDYNEDLDQIVISLRKMSEIAIIDHSTTTSEAAGHAGGNAGKGGDLLYRWGNPANYDQGETADQEFSHQHNPNWIHYGPFKDMIITFNNRLSFFNETFSSVDIICPPLDTNQQYLIDTSGAYGPSSVTWRYDESGSVNPMYSGYTSGAKVLPNGNILISVGQEGQLLEVTADKEKVWDYRLPLPTYLFRAVAYPLSYPGLANQTLIPNGTIESPSSPYNCTLFTSTDDNIQIEMPLSITVDEKGLTFSSAISTTMNMSIYDMNGIELSSLTKQGMHARINSHLISNGVYIAVLKTSDSMISKKILISR